MADPQRLKVDKFILHHAVTPTWENKSKAELAQWFSDTGFARGYSSNPANWSGLTNPYTNARSYSMAAFAGQRVDGSTPDATDAERAAGYRVVQLVNDPWGQITWNAGNWPVNQSCIGLENLGDYRNYPLRDGDVKVLADFWRPQDRALGGQTSVYGHIEVSQLGTQCPARVMEGRDLIVHYINNPPAAPAPPAPVEQPAPVAANPYVRFPEPMNLVAGKQPTNAYDLSKTTWADLNAAVIKTLNQGDEFVAVGKYTHPLGGVYFMTAFSFGQADVTGKPDHTYGVNTVDLAPAPAPAAPAEPVSPTIPAADPVPETPVTDTSAADNGSVSVPVKVVPVDPNKWQDSFVAAPQEFIARMDAVIHDLAGKMPDIKLVQHQTVHVAGQFTKDGVKYYRTKRSVAEGWWYGIPIKTNSIDTLLESDDVFNLGDLNDELKSITNNLTVKEKLIKFFAWLFGWMRRK